MLALCGRQSVRGTVLIESCHSTWEFDSSQHRFRRVPVSSQFTSSVPWQSYTRVVLREDAEGMEVYLTGGQRVLRTWRHVGPCAACGLGTSELSLAAIANHPAEPSRPPEGLDSPGPELGR